MDFNGLDIAISCIFLALKVYGHPVDIETFLDILEPQERRYWRDYLPKSDSFLAHELNYDLEIESVFTQVENHIRAIFANYQHSLRKAGVMENAVQLVGKTTTRALYDTDACLLLTSLQFTMAALLCLELPFPELKVKRYFSEVVFCDAPERKILWQKVDAFMKKVVKFQFLTFANRAPRIERALEKCINPLYNIRSQEYANEVTRNQPPLDDSWSLS